jgi:hypothetical protein
VSGMDSHTEARRHRGYCSAVLCASVSLLCEISFSVVFLLVLCGCVGSDGAADVDGEVLLDGQPLADGVIHFFPVAGTSRTESAFIKGGQFHKRVPLGKHRVEISSVQARPTRPGQDADSAAGAEIVPARYNTKSELSTEVSRGKNKAKFELKGK